MADWGKYIHNNLLNHKISNVALLKIEDGSIIGTSNGFSIKCGDEKETILKYFQNKDSSQISSLSINGIRYIVMSKSDKSIIAMKSGWGVIIYKTNTLIIVALFYKIYLKPGNAEYIIESFGNHLINNNF